MIPYKINLFATPLLLLVWAIDVYLFLAGIRLILGHFSAPWCQRACTWLQAFTDPLPRALCRWLGRKRRRPFSPRLSWMFVIFTGIAARYLIIALVLSIP